MNTSPSSGKVQSVKALVARVIPFALVALLTACPQNDAPDTLSPDEQDDFTDGYVADIERSVDGISLDETISVVSVPNPGVQAQGLETVGVTALALPSGCKTIQAGSNADSDKDGIPDNLTIEFNAAKCERPRLLGGTRTQSGTIQIQDTSSTTVGYLEKTDLTFIENLPGGRVITDVRKSQATLTGNSSRFTKTFNTNLRHTVSGRGTTTYINGTTYEFTSGGGNVVFGDPLPAGSVVITGRSEWFAGTKRIRQFSVVTPSPLQFVPEATCAEQRIVGGTQVLTQNRSTLTITFQPCGTRPKFEFAL